MAHHFLGMGYGEIYDLPIRRIVTLFEINGLIGDVMGNEKEPNVFGNGDKLSAEDEARFMAMIGK
jgi:hypothetical protein